MNRAQRTHYLIADGARARWVVRKPGSEDLSTVREFTADKPVHDAGPPGAVFESMGSRRSGTQDANEPKERQRKAFAAKLLQMLDEEAAVDAYERLVVVAPPRMLALFREGLSGRPRAMLVGEVPRDLTKVADHDLGRWLHAV